MAWNNNNLVDVNNELYVHPSDATSLTLVSKVFDGSSYKSWRRAMLMALSAKNKTGFITGKCVKPEDDSKLLPLWVRCNDLVGTWICNSVEPNIGESIMYFDTAHEMWKDLEERFGQSNGIDLYNVQKNICDITQAPDSLSGYYTRIKKLWDEMATIHVIPPCTCGAGEAIKRFIEDQKLVQFLKGLDSEDKNSCNNLLMMRPLPSVSNAYGMLKQQESHSLLPQKSTQISNEASSFQAGGNFFSRNNHGLNTFHNGNQINQGNYRPSILGRGRGRGDFRRTSLVCDHCKRPGHHISKCYKIIGYPSESDAYRAKKTANFVQGENDNAANTGNSGENAAHQGNMQTLSQEQKNELLNFLMKNSAQPAQQPVQHSAQHSVNFVTSNAGTSTDTLSGPFQEEATGAW